MTPREVDELSDAEYVALVRYANNAIKAEERALKRRR